MKQYRKNRCTVGHFARIYGVSKVVVEGWWDGSVVPPLAAFTLMEHWHDIVPLLNDAVPKREKLGDMTKQRNYDAEQACALERKRRGILRTRYRNGSRPKLPVTIMEEFYQTHYYSNARLAKLFGTCTTQIERWRNTKNPLPQYVLDFINTSNADNHLTDEHLALLKVVKGIEPTSFL